MSTFSPSFLIYGATGYTGRLVVAAAVAAGLKPILGARDEAAVKALAEQYGLRHRAFTLEDRNALDAGVTGVRLVVNLAGPFVGTGSALAQSCIRVGAHYIDISGETADFRMLEPLTARAADAGVLLLPGVGFGILATDCLIQHAYARHPSAVRVQIGVRAAGKQLSRGTMSTMIENLRIPGFRRVAGQLKPAKPCESAHDFDFGPGGKATCWNFPWRADVMTVGMHTQIAHADFFFAMPFVLRNLIRSPALAQNATVRKLLLRGTRGPSPAERQKNKSYCVAETVDETGRTQSTLLVGPDPYDFTVRSVLYSVKAVLAGRQEEGLYSPAQLFGSAPLKAIPGLQLIDR